MGVNAIGRGADAVHLRPVLEKHDHHRQERGEPVPAPARRFDIAAMLPDPAGFSCAFGIRGIDPKSAPSAPISEGDRSIRSPLT